MASAIRFLLIGGAGALALSPAAVMRPQVHHAAARPAVARMGLPEEDAGRARMIAFALAAGLAAGLPMREASGVVVEVDAKAILANYKSAKMGGYKAAQGATPTVAPGVFPDAAAAAPSAPAAKVVVPQQSTVKGRKLPNANGIGKVVPTTKSAPQPSAAAAPKAVPKAATPRAASPKAAAVPAPAAAPAPAAPKAAPAPAKAAPKVASAPTAAKPAPKSELTKLKDGVKSAQAEVAKAKEGKEAATKVRAAEKKVLQAREALKKGLAKVEGQLV